jgi:DDE superfamily endonuclease
VSPGHVHDYQMFKDSKVEIPQETTVLVDSGYQGIQKVIPKSILPIKKVKGGHLTPEMKAANHELSSQRICIEHTNRKLKIFRILGGVYRNKLKRFELRVYLLAAIHNLNLVN